MMRPVERFYTALHQCSKVSYSRHDLLKLGIQDLGYLFLLQKLL